MKGKKSKNQRRIEKEKLEGSFAAAIELKVVGACSITGRVASVEDKSRVVSTMRPPPLMFAIC